MKVSKQKAAENRAAMVAAAGRLFRERGFEGVSLAEISQAAGLTHGGFYGQFGSKEALAAEACSEAFDEALDGFAARTRAEGLAGYLQSYLSERHRDRRDGGCPMPALAADAARHGPPVQAAFAAGVRRYLEAMERLPDARSEGGTEGREEAILTLAAMVGALALSRATAAADPALSSEILSVVRHRLGAVPKDRRTG